MLAATTPERRAASSQAGGRYPTLPAECPVLTFALLTSLPLWRKVNSVVPPDSVASEVASGVAGADAGAATGTEAGEDAAGPPRTHVSLATALRIPGVVLVLIAFFAYCALESTVIWAATYLVGDRGVDAATAAAFASLFLIGITGGRFLAGFFADRVGDRALIRGGFVMVGVGVVMLALPLAVLVALGLVMSERLGRVVDAAR